MRIEIGGRAVTGDGWFEGLDPDDLEGAVAAITVGEARAPADWPAQAVPAGFTTDESACYETLHEATVRGAEEIVRGINRDYTTMRRTETTGWPSRNSAEK